MAEAGGGGVDAVAAAPVPTGYTAATSVPSVGHWKSLEKKPDDFDPEGSGGTR